MRHPIIVAEIGASHNGSLDAALDLIEADSHSYGTRPCATCTAVSALAGRPFGCVKRAAMSRKDVL